MTLTALSVPGASVPAMPLPISGNQLKKLTRRLRDGTAEPADWDVLADVLLFYNDVLDRAHADVERLCAAMPLARPMTPRVKTLKTTLEKLHRQPELYSIAQIRDIAGLRIVVHGTRLDQDEVVSRVAEGFPDRTPKVIDRRLAPKQGYRAVHLEVRRDDLLIEIQVRTELQHRWAELFERTADKLGRGLRYGEPVRQAQDEGRAAELVAMLQSVAYFIDKLETEEAAGNSGWSDTRRPLAGTLDELGVMLDRLP